MQAYNSRKRENDAHALPNIEIFKINERDEEADALEPGFYWWSCFPGCLPDGEPNGPFKDEEEALADAREAEEAEDAEDDDDEEAGAIIERERKCAAGEDCSECRAVGHVPPSEEPITPVVRAETQTTPGRVWVVMTPWTNGHILSEVLGEVDGPSLAIQIAGNPKAYTDIALFATRAEAVVALAKLINDRIGDYQRLLKLAEADG